MKLGYKKWFSILGLLAAILISLFIGLTFDLSILEGMTPGEEMPILDDVTPGEEEEEVIPGEEEVMPGEEEEVIPGEEEYDMTLADMSEYTPSPLKKGESIYKNTMDTPIETFSLIQNY